MPQDESRAITTGITKEQGDTFSVNTVVTVGASVGVTAGAKPFGVGAETTVTASVSATVEMGYERRTNITAMREETPRPGG
ncbi:hypothetical protein ACF073_37905 [Streptomyces sp. NPDC015171]|uniref:hypothetical protein n=1 Tax=Streptomyces sp. NPDC015171 TaxID=3364945 RepID=UPI0036FED98A